MSCPAQYGARFENRIPFTRVTFSETRATSDFYRVFGAHLKYTPDRMTNAEDEDQVSNEDPDRDKTVSREKLSRASAGDDERRISH